MVAVDSWKKPGCSSCSVRWVDGTVSVVVSNESSVASSVPSSSPSPSSASVVGTASVTVVVLGGGWAVVVVVVVVVVLVVVVLAVVVEVLVEVVDVDGRGGDGCESYRFNDDSSRRRFQTPPSTSLVSKSARKTDMCRCSPYIRFIRPWFSKTNRRTACL